MSARLALALAGVIGATAFAVVWHFRSAAAAEAERAIATSRQNAELRFELKQTRERADDLAGRLAEADKQLGSAKSRVNATDTRSAQLTRELNSARASLTEREQREVALLAQLEELRGQSRSPAVTPPPSPAPASTPANVAALEQRIAMLEAQLLEVLTRALAEMPAAELIATDAPEVESPPQAVQIGARNAFVVINRGSDHGARPGDVCAFVRAGTELALGRLSEVRPRFAIVHLLPGSLKGQLQAGDIAVLAN